MGKKKQIKKLTAANDDLKQTLATVRTRLTKTRTKLDHATDKAKRWKTEAAAHKTAATRADARTDRLRKKLDRATDAQQPPETAKAKTTTTEPSRARAAKAGGREPARSGSIGTDGLTAPSESWTVVQLRAEARARGLTGLSNKPKAALVAALNQPADPPA